MKINDSRSGDPCHGVVASRVLSRVSVRTLDMDRAKAPHIQRGSCLSMSP